MLNTIDEPLNIAYIKKIHFEVCKGQVANKEMIRNGLGILSLPVEKIGEYFTLLISYYETNNMEDLKKWIYDNCIDGV